MNLKEKRSCANVAAMKICKWLLCANVAAQLICNSCLFRALETPAGDVAALLNNVATPSVRTATECESNQSSQLVLLPNPDRRCIDEDCTDCWLPQRYLLLDPFIHLKKSHVVTDLLQQVSLLTPAVSVGLKGSMLHNKQAQRCTPPLCTWLHPWVFNQQRNLIDFNFFKKSLLICALSRDEDLPSSLSMWSTVVV